ncbi:MAG TPA: 4-hydroxy-tetrahydrodipicolinate synthase, partial [Legionellales bacterium]|nr:4-hydroxy-tetrahydrodipicolinate synthase [Legionellales bacterium]
ISALEWLLNGAKGVISVTANVAANAMAMLCEAALNHDKSRSLAINKTLKSLHEQLFIESNPIPVKWALYKMGLIENDIRLPLTPLTQAYQTNIEQILLKLDLLKH